tara:strand:+ start:2586 stop:2813 length:228 start_codon:yes stop_codon:yes gene_type:complete
MISIENIESGAVFEGQEIEYFLDDDTMIGEVYIDGNLIFQSVDVNTESQLQLEFRKEYILHTTNELHEIIEDFLD